MRDFLGAWAGRVGPFSGYVSPLCPIWDDREVADIRQRRMAQNEASARRTNDEAEYQRPRNGGLPHPFVCECVREHCNEALDLEIGEYVNVRSHPRRFVVVPGHEEPDVESVIAVYAGYVVVQKRGEAGRLAEAEASG